MFRLVDRLYHYALTEVCLNLYTLPLLRHVLIPPFYFTEDVVVPGLVDAVARRRDVPERLKPDFVAEIKRLAREIEIFCRFASKYATDLYRFAEHLVWNGEGAIDAKRTFVSAIRGTAGFDLEEKFRMACSVCDRDSLRLVANSEGFDIVEAKSRIVIDSTYGFYLHRENLLRNPVLMCETALRKDNPFAFEFFYARCPDGTDLYIDPFVKKSEETARIVFPKFSLDRQHVLVPFVMSYYRRRDRFRYFESDFWNVLDPAVKERTLSHFCGERTLFLFGGSFCDCDDEEILFFANLLTEEKRKNLLYEMWHGPFFRSRFRTEFVVRLLRTCEKETARNWIKDAKNRLNPMIIRDLLSKNLI